MKNKYKRRKKSLPDSNNSQQEMGGRNIRAEEQIGNGITTWNTAKTRHRRQTQQHGKMSNLLEMLNKARGSLTEKIITDWERGRETGRERRKKERERERWGEIKEREKREC